MAHEIRPYYRLVTRDGKFEIRAYEPMRLAEVRMQGPRRIALNEGFKILFGYISGQNDLQKKLPMAVPVTAQCNVEGYWAVRFILPMAGEFADLPQPKDKRIALFEVQVARAAVKRFSGLAGDNAIARETARLKDWITQEKLNPVGSPTCAWYNSPMSLPFLRHNEIMIGLDY